MVYDILRDLYLSIRVVALIAIFYMAYQTGKKIKEYKFLSATTGFTLFLISFGIFHFGTAIYPLYQDQEITLVFDYIGNISFLVGMALFVFLTEIDENKHLETTTNKRIKYPLTLINIIGVIILFPISVISLFFSVFIFAVIPFAIASVTFLKKFTTLKIVKESRPTVWFLVGLTLAGTSNFLYNPFLVNILGYYTVLDLNSLFVIIGALFMTRGWNKLPSSIEFDWMKKMERLLVVHLETSTLLYEYNFKTRTTGKDNKEVSGDLAGSAISGINMLLKEILSSKGHIKQIDHQDKTIFFTNGEATVSIIITTGESEEYKYRLELFELDFEKKYGINILKQFDGDLSAFKDVNSLVIKHFL